METEDAETGKLAEASEERQRIKFSTLQIRHFPIICGDNPAVTFGCPLTIDWQYDDEVTLSIDEYEEGRSAPRSMIELRMPSALRERMLRELGFSRMEIQQSTKAATIARNRRKRTEETMKLAPIQEAIERAKRGALNLTIKRRAKHKETQQMKELLKLAKGRRSSKSSETVDLSIFSLAT